MALISCENLKLGYEGKTIAEDISFQVNEGDYLCIVGENGSGKSTLMKVMMGLKAPMSGEIVFADGLKKNEIGYLPQQTPVQRDFPASVEEIVLSGFINKMKKRFFYTKEEKRQGDKILDKLEILPLKKKCYRELSGGQQQRVLLARALLATGKVLLLDEPTAGLDPLASAQMYEMISRLNKEGIAIIMISHDINEATTYASHILHMGYRPFYFGPVAGYLETPGVSNFCKGVKEND